MSGLHIVTAAFTEDEKKLIEKLYITHDMLEEAATTLEKAINDNSGNVSSKPEVVSNSEKIPGLIRSLIYAIENFIIEKGSSRYIDALGVTAFKNTFREDFREIKKFISNKEIVSRINALINDSNDPVPQNLENMFVVQSADDNLWNIFEKILSFSKQSDKKDAINLVNESDVVNHGGNGGYIENVPDVKFSSDEVTESLPDTVLGNFFKKYVNLSEAFEDAMSGHTENLNMLTEEEKEYLLHLHDIVIDYALDYVNNHWDYNNSLYRMKKQNIVNNAVSGPEFKAIYAKLPQKSAVKMTCDYLKKLDKIIDAY